MRNQKQSPTNSAATGRRISQDVEHFLEARRRTAERRQLRRDYEIGVVSGRHPEHVTLHPLYPYQREGMLHLALPCGILPRQLSRVHDNSLA